MQARRLSFASLLVAGGGAVILFAVAVLSVTAQAPQFHRNGFETTALSWQRDHADADFTQKSHTRTDDASHDGQRCEHIQLTVSKPGTFIHYKYATPRAPVTPELNIGLWVKANRPGVKLIARVVLPNERDPKSLDDRLTTYLEGDAYRLAGRWQALAISRPDQLAKKMQMNMQGALNRPINFTDAYVDALFLNVYGGPGQTEVWIDDLLIGPVLDDKLFQATKVPRPARTTPELAPQPRQMQRALNVEFNGSQLVIDSKRFFMRAIRHTDTPLPVLRNAGFNTLWVDHTTAPEVLREGVSQGFVLVPSLSVASSDQHLVSTNSLGQEISRFSEIDHVAFWDVGLSLPYEQAGTVARAVKQIRATDPGRPIGGGVWDGLQVYSHQLNLVGIHRWPLMTTLELDQYREWLDQKRRLARPGTFFWTWIQTHTPETYAQLLYNQRAQDTFKDLVGPQPEQIRLLTYAALGAGCRGLGFWSDRFLADSHMGRDRLLTVAVLNQELEMLEPLLSIIDDPPMWVPTSEPAVKAAVFRTAKGVLVLPMWLGKGAQLVPGQAAVAKLKVVVPQVPQGTQAWEVTPGDVRSYRTERVAGGTQVTLPEFGLTTALIFTADVNLITRFQQQVWGRRKLAAQWSYELAVQELAKVNKITRELEKGGHATTKATQLLQDAEQRLQAAKQHWDSGMFSEAYHEAQRAMRPMRILMRVQWEHAIEGLDSPTSSPFAVSYYTLPKHWQMIEAIRQTTPGENMLQGGSFEADSEQEVRNWVLQDATLDEVSFRAERVAEVSNKDGKAPIKAKDGGRFLHLQISPKPQPQAKTPEVIPAALERTYLSINSPQVKLPPGSLVQISGWVCVPGAIKASVDGAMLFDSAAGEPFALRLTDATEWKKFTFYRRVPQSGTLHLTMALTGIGSVCFDDIRIESLTPPATQSSNSARQ